MRANKPDSQEKRLDPTGLLHLMVVYVVWSSTYLAIRIAVREGAGFPPFTMGLTRALLGGVILLIWSRLIGRSLRLTGRDMLVLAGSGLLLWLGGNGLVTYAEQRADSGLAALVVAATPIWVAVIEAIIDRRLPTGQLVLALLIGFSGIGLLTVPELQSGDQADAIAVLALIGATVAWSLGSVLQARNPVDLSDRASAGYQMLFGAVGFTVVALLVGEPLPTPTTESWLAWAYLVIFGSVLAFTSYVTALRVLPTRVVMTYAYVNPVLAVALGWFVLNEEVTLWTLLGSALVLLGVAGVFRERRVASKKRDTAPAEPV